MNSSNAKKRTRFSNKDIERILNEKMNRLPDDYKKHHHRRIRLLHALPEYPTSNQILKFCHIKRYINKRHYADTIGVDYTDLTSMKFNESEDADISRLMNDNLWVKIVVFASGHCSDFYGLKDSSAFNNLEPNFYDLIDEASNKQDLYTAARIVNYLYIPLWLGGNYGWVGVLCDLIRIMRTKKTLSNSDLISVITEANTDVQDMMWAEINRL